MTARAGSPALQARLAQVLGHRDQPLPFLLAAEQVGSHLIVLPPAKARQRAAMLAFAAEERIAAPLDATLVAPGPVVAGSGTPQLTFVVARRVIDACPQDAPRVLPEFLLIPRPATGWAVWRDDDRSVVRAADGTGFAAATSVLPLMWDRAGRPEVLSYGAPLPAAIPHDDLSSRVPPPDPVELAYGLPRVRPGDAARTWRPVILAGALLAAGLVAHLALLAVDVAALDRIAEADRQAAQAAIAGPLPGVTVTANVAPILQRLAPSVAAPAGSPALRLLADVSATLAATDATATLRRMAWASADDTLVVLVQAGGLEALQAIERGLTGAGFTVRSGAASAGDGGAEVELRISRGSA